MDARTEETLTRTDELRKKIVALRNPDKEITEIEKQELNKPVIYYVFIPITKQKIKVSKLNRNIIFEIAFADFSSLSMVTQQIIKECLLKLSSKKEVQDLRHYLELLQDHLQALNKKEKITAADLNSIFKMITEKGVFSDNEYPLLIKSLEHLDTFIDKANESKDLYQELKLWLQGLHLHYSMHIVRKEIEELRANSAMQTMVPYPMPDKKQQDISKAEATAMEMIAKMITEQSQPIALSLLRDMAKHAIADPQFAQTKESINSMFAQLWEANEMDYDKSVTEKLEHLTAIKDVVFKDLERLLDAMKKVYWSENVAPELNILWIVLAGMYKHYWNKKSDLKTMGEDATISYKTSGKVKSRLEIMDYYHKAAMIIRNQEFISLQPIQKVADQPDASLPYKIERKDENGRIILTIEVSANNKNIMALIQTGAKSLLEAKSVLSAEKWGNRLQRYISECNADEVNDKKITGLEHLINAYSFPLEFFALKKKIDDAATCVPAGYSSSAPSFWSASGAVKNTYYAVRGRVNDFEAKQFREQIKALQTPHEQVLRIFTERQTLKTLGSVDLLKEIEKMLLMVFDYIVDRKILLEDDDKAMPIPVTVKR